jgi:hypothetical protein
MRQGTSLQRWIPVTGIVFIPLFIVGIMLADQPLSGRNSFELVDFYRDTGNRVQVLIGGYVLTVAGLVLLPFLNHLRSVIQEAEDERLLSVGAYGTGLVFVGLFLAGAAASTAIPAGIHFDETLQTELPSADVALYMPALGFTLIFLMGMFTAGVMFVTTALASFQYKLFPSWFAWLSIVCALVLLLAALSPFLSLVALPVWLLATSVVLLRRRPAQRSSPGSMVST